MTVNKRGMGVHQSSRMLNDEWLTPPEILGALGNFDLDPCSPIIRPWDTAARHYSIEDNGLQQPWVGRVWLNPPYGRETGVWLQRLADHGNGIALAYGEHNVQALRDSGLPGWLCSGWEKVAA